jgi:hypothetical protein
MQTNSEEKEAMTTRKIEANRRNAKRSTGPRSAAGKTRSRQNAYRHGLAAAARLGGPASPALAALISKLVGDNPTIERLVHARSVAEAQLTLDRICQVRADLINAGLRRGQQDSVNVQSQGFDEAAALCGVLPELLQLVRYEDCAFARRRRAMRLLMR